MAHQRLRVAIIGAGTAGPAAAVLLARAGHRVTLYERAPVNLPVGAGFLLQPTGMNVLKQLGLLETLLPHTAPIRRLHCLDRRSRALLNLDYEEVSPGLRGAGTHRALLLEILLKAAMEAGAAVLWDHTILELQRQSDGRPLLCDGRGVLHGPFDLVLLCDGAQSVLRAQSGIPCRVGRYPWGALWFIGRRPEAFAADTLWQRVGTTRELVGFLPTGTQEDLVSFFWSIRLADVEAWRAGSLAEWKAGVLRHAPQAAPLFDQIRRHEQLAVAVYHDVRMPRWHGDRVAVLGDAGHALSPQLGQGVNLALMDAAQLAASLETDESLVRALAHFSVHRRRHLGFYQLTTRSMTPFFQSDSVTLGHIRDATFPLLGKIPWVRRQMVTTMAGLKTGFFSQLRRDLA